MSSLFTSESVTEGHPDKLADQISDAILDAILAKDPLARVACEAIVTTGLALVVGFGACVTASVVLGMLGYIPDQYMQPVSALYAVPFLVLLIVLKRPAGVPVMLLWPALYALHAILIMAGAPILFTGKWDGLNMLIPAAGYGILTGLVGHAYNRFALHRLRRLAQMNLPGAGGRGAPQG